MVWLVGKSKKKEILCSQGEIVLVTFSELTSLRRHTNHKHIGMQINIREQKLHPERIIS